jgi:hypothetical protein
VVPAVLEVDGQDTAAGPAPGSGLASAGDAGDLEDERVLVAAGRRSSLSALSDL